MNKEELISELKRRLDLNQHTADELSKLNKSEYQANYWLCHRYDGKVEAFKIALALAESMHDESAYQA